MAKKRAKVRKKSTPVAKAVKPVKRGPSSQVLPGLEQVRHRVLDNLCEGIADVRASLARARQEEGSYLQSALKEMQSREVKAYRHAGVELLRVPGDEHLRVRTVKEKANIDRADEPATADEMADEGSGE